MGPLAVYRYKDYKLEFLHIAHLFSKIEKYSWSRQDLTQLVGGGTP